MGTKGEGNRQRIIEAADGLFYRRGYNQTSFQDISEATGIPREQAKLFAVLGTHSREESCKSVVVGLTVLFKGMVMTFGTFKADTHE